MSLLASIYALIGADLSQLDRQFSSAVKKGAKAGADLGREFQSQLKRSLASGAAFGTGGMAATMGLDGVGSLLDSLKLKFVAIGQVGGIDYAAQIQRQSVAYTKLFGSARQARDVIRQIQKDSVETGTSSLENLAALRKFNALPVAKEALPGILRTTNDTAAAYGLNGGERRRLVDNIGDIFGNGFDKAQSNQFQMLGLNVEKTLGLGLGRTFRNEAEALAGVKGMSSIEQGNAFIRGLEKQFGGMGKQTAEGTLLGRLEQAKELALQAGEASGTLALKLLTPLAGGLVLLAGGLKTVNDATGGGAGLIAMLLAGGAVMVQTVRTGMVAWSALKLLNAELLKLAGTAPAATAGTGLLGRLSLTPTGPAPTGIGGALLGAGTGKGALIATALGIGIPLIAGARGNSRVAESSMKGSIMGGVVGAIAGGLLGAVAGGVGALPGAMAGYTYGTGGGALLGALAGANQPASRAEKAAEKQEKAAEKMDVAATKLASATVIGGSSRVKSAADSTIAAFALLNAF